MTGKEKGKFRQKKVWKEFRKKIISKRKKCEFCGGKFRLNLHHKDKDPNHYANLIDDNFLLLCNPCHKQWERLLSIKDKSNFLPEMVSILKRFTL